MSEKDFANKQIKRIFHSIKYLTCSFKKSSKYVPLFLFAAILNIDCNCHHLHCVKSVHIQNYSDPHFPAFRLNTERYKVSFRIQSKCDRITPNTDTFLAVLV